MSNGINLRTNREMASHQIADLMFVITNSVSAYRMADANLPMEGDAPRADADDGGPKMALASVINRACDRLETILNDGDQWKMPATDFREYAATQLGQQIRQGETILRAQAAQIALQGAMEQLRPRAPEAQRPQAHNNAPEKRKKNHGK